ncbi:diphthine methyl ester synthase isoform X2 [Halyomorpha halys]|uniref:diphthine methyl ester synthase isoform X2 n=1 Tax=Halyomorpha halys TaxID=286706 RepID=UPI0034D220E4
MFYVIGIGLGDAKDITVKGLEIVKSASRVYLEMFTSVLSVGKDGLEKFYGRDVIIADRELVEMDADTILFNADKEDVAFLVLYNFGETVSIPFWTDSWKPDSFFEKICSNKLRGLHTLCLLDIKVKEPTPESITKKKKEYLPPMFMTASEASRQLMEIVKNSNSSVIDGDTQCVGVARVGSDEQEIICCSLSEMIMKNLGKPLHSLVIVGKLHPLEEEYLNFLSN